MSAVSRRGLHLAEVLASVTDGFGPSGEGHVTGMMPRLVDGHVQRCRGGAGLARSDRHFLESRKHKASQMRGWWTWVEMRVSVRVILCVCVRANHLQLQQQLLSLGPTDGPICLTQPIFLLLRPSVQAP